MHRQRRQICRAAFRDYATLQTPRSQAEDREEMNELKEHLETLDGHPHLDLNTLEKYYREIAWSQRPPDLAVHVAQSARAISYYPSELQLLALYLFILVDCSCFLCIFFICCIVFRGCLATGNALRAFQVMPHGMKAKCSAVEDLISVDINRRGTDKLRCLGALWHAYLKLLLARSPPLMFDDFRGF